MCGLRIPLYMQSHPFLFLLAPFLSSLYPSMLTGVFISRYHILPMSSRKWKKDSCHSSQRRRIGYCIPACLGKCFPLFYTLSKLKEYQKVYLLYDRKQTRNLPKSLAQYQTVSMAGAGNLEVVSGQKVILRQDQVCCVSFSSLLGGLEN